MTATDTGVRLAYLDALISTARELSSQLEVIDGQVKSLTGSDLDLNSFNRVERMYESAVDKHSTTKQTLKDTEEFIERIEQTTAILNNEIAEIEQL